MYRGRGGLLEHPPVRGAEVGVPPEVELTGEVHGWRQVPGGVDELGQMGGKRGSVSGAGIPSNDFGGPLPLQVCPGVPYASQS